MGLSKLAAPLFAVLKGKYPQKANMGRFSPFSENDFIFRIFTPVGLVNTHLTDRGLSRLSYFMPGAAQIIPDR